MRPLSAASLLDLILSYFARNDQNSVYSSEPLQNETKHSDTLKRCIFVTNTSIFNLSLFIYYPPYYNEQINVSHVIRCKVQTFSKVQDLVTQ